MKEKLVYILAQFFGEEIRDMKQEEIIPENFDDRWDSKTHLTLIIALEEEFGISIEPDETLDMLEGFKTILKILRSKGVN